MTWLIPDFSGRLRILTEFNYAVNLDEDGRIISAEVTEVGIAHSDDVLLSDIFDEDGNPIQHFGIKGMKWGRRNAESREREGRAGGTPTGATPRTNREARKDADEFAKAKMFYGEGAGTRRKLIKATVDAKSNKDPEYKKAFEYHLDNQNLAKRAEGARSERRRKDVTASATKNARSVHRLLTGGMGNVTATASVIVGAYSLAKATGYDKKIAGYAKQGYNVAKDSGAAKLVRDAFKNKGW